MIFVEIFILIFFLLGNIGWDKVGYMKYENYFCINYKVIKFQAALQTSRTPARMLSCLQRFCIRHDTTVLSSVQSAGALEFGAPAGAALLS